MHQKQILQEPQSKLGVAVVIGAMLILAIMFIYAVQYQLNVVPQQEEQTEIQHSQTVGDEMIGLRNDVMRVSSSGTQESSRVTLGTTFGGGQIAGIIPVINQPSPPGTIRTTRFEGGDTQLSVSNADGVGSSRNFWNGNTYTCDSPSSPSATGANKCYNTTSIVYEPDYNHLREAPTSVYENTVIYDRIDREGLNAGLNYVMNSDQALVEGKTINLVTLTGDFRKTGVQQETVELYPASAPTNTISVEGDTTLTVRTPTHLPEREWEQLLADQDYVSSVSVEGIGVVWNSTSEQYEINETRALNNGPYDGVHQGLLEIEFDAGETYALKMSRIHASTSIDATERLEDAQYVGWTGTENLVLREDSQHVVEGQVRDRYNNPVVGETVHAYARDTSSGGTCVGDFPNSAEPSAGDCTAPVLQPGEKTSIENGNVEFVYESPETSEDKEITISLELQD